MNYLLSNNLKDLNTYSQLFPLAKLMQEDHIHLTWVTECSQGGPGLPHWWGAPSPHYKDCEPLMPLVLAHLKCGQEPKLMVEPWQVSSWIDINFWGTWTSYSPPGYHHKLLVVPSGQGLFCLCSCPVLSFAVTGANPVFLSCLQESSLAAWSEAPIKVYKGFPFVMDTELLATSSWKYSANIQQSSTASLLVLNGICLETDKNKRQLQGKRKALVALSWGNLVQQWKMPVCFLPCLQWVLMHIL